MKKVVQMKKDNFDRLTPFEMQLENVRRYSYLRVTPQEQSILFAIYEDEYSTKLTSSQKNCRRCVLNTLKKLAEDYSAHKINISKTEEDDGRKPTKKVKKKKEE